MLPTPVGTPRSSIAITLHVSDDPSASALEGEQREAMLEQLAEMRDGLVASGHGTPSDHELWRRIMHAAEHGAQELDLTGCKAALRRLPPEAMEVLGALCNHHVPPTTCIVLPAGLKALPSWLRAFHQVAKLEVNRFAGARLDARMLPSLTKLTIVNISFERAVEVRVPPACSVEPMCADGKPATLEPRRREGHWRILPRAVSLNYAGKFDDDNPIVCRHLALGVLEAWAEATMRERVGIALAGTGDPLGLLDTPEGISRAIPQEFQAIFMKLARAPRESYMVSFSRWDEFLVGCAARTSKSQKDVTYMIIRSGNHAIPARLLRTSEGAWKLEVRDPNSQVPKASQPPFHFKECLPLPHRFDDYFPDRAPAFGPRKFAHIIIVHDPLEPAASARTKQGKGHVSLDHMDLDDMVHPEAAMQVSEIETPDALDAVEHVFKKADLTPAQCIAFLRGCPDVDLPWLTVCMLHGHPDAVHTFGRLLLQAFHRGLIGRAEILELLGRQHGQTDPPLVKAMQKNHSECISNFCRLLAKLHAVGALTAEDVLTLARARGPHGQPSFLFLQKKETAVAYIEGVRMLRKEGSIPKEDANSLIEDAKSML